MNTEIPHADALFNLFNQLNKLTVITTDPQQKQKDGWTQELTVQDNDGNDHFFNIVRTTNEIAYYCDSYGSTDEHQTDYWGIKVSTATATDFIVKADQV